MGDLTWKDVASLLAASDRGLAIAADNTAVLASLATVDVRQCFAVRLVSSWTAVDCDDPSRAGELARVASLAADAGLSGLWCDSGRPGHAHLFLSCDSSLIRPVLAANGFDVRDWIRPPLSPHREGLPVAARSLSGVTCDVSAAFALVASAGPDDGSALFGLLTSRRFPRRCVLALRHGHRAGGYLSQSEARMAVAVAGVAAGLPSSWLASALAGSVLWSNSAHKGDRWRSRELDRLWAKASAYVSRDVGLEVWWRSLDGFSWSGRAGGVDLAVAEALFRLARKFNRLRFFACRDDLALAAGVAPSTLRRSLPRLVARGLLRTERPSPRSATVFTLTLPSVCPAGSGDHHTGDRAPTVALSSSWDNHPSDLGSRWSSRLTKQQMRVWRALSTGVRSPADLARMLNVDVVQVRRALTVLESHGLAERHGRDGRSTLFRFCPTLDASDARHVTASAMLRDRRRRSEERAAALARRVE